MQIEFPTQCIIGGQVYSGDENINTAKSDNDCYFLPASHVYWRSYIVRRIKNWRLGS